MSNENLTVEFHKQIDHGKQIYESMVGIKIDGVSKLQNKVKQEIHFLEKRLKSSNVKKEHLACSNLTHLEAVTHKLTKHQKECSSVMTNKTLSYDDGTVRKICVDLMLQGGAVWVKVIARNPKALTMVSSGEGCYGQKGVTEQASEFLDCAQQHLHFFKVPTVIFYFANGIESALRKELEMLGITVECQNSSSVIIDEFDDESYEGVVSDMVKCPIPELEIERNFAVIKDMQELKLNLGVTTMIAYVSALTNGGCHCSFETAILNQHALWEQARPVKPVLDQLFQGRELYCCTTAAEDFQNILNTLGGPGEKTRGEEFMKRVTVVADVPTNKLRSGGKIKDRSLAIFGTGEHLHAVTVTANHGFVRAARNQAVNFAVFLHESRALTEAKQLPLET